MYLRCSKQIRWVTLLPSIRSHHRCKRSFATVGDIRRCDPESHTGKLCNWVHSASLEQIPDQVKGRAKHLILDGIACALVAAHLPWSETAARAVLNMESAGPCDIVGWDKVGEPYESCRLCC